MVIKPARDPGLVDHRTVQVNTERVFDAARTRTKKFGSSIARIADDLKQAGIEEGQWSEKREVQAPGATERKARINRGRDRVAAEKAAAVARGECGGRCETAGLPYSTGVSEALKGPGPTPRKPAVKFLPSPERRPSVPETPRKRERRNSAAFPSPCPIDAPAQAQYQFRSEPANAAPRSWQRHWSRRCER
jgi:hypothetical protein